MTERRLRYPERKLLAETGSLGDLVESPTLQLRQAVYHALTNATGRLTTTAATAFSRAVQEECEEYFGWGQQRPDQFILEAGTEDLLALLEIVIEIGAQQFQSTPGYSTKRTAWASAESDLNKLFDRHRFGFRLTNGEAHPVTSPALDQAVVGPALLAATKPGWDEVEKSYREALLHQRGGRHENDDALTAASAALEAALKAQGYKGNTLGALAKDFKNRGPIDPQVQGMADALDKLLKITAAVRNTLSDGHGKHSGSTEPSDAIVALSVHMVGAFLVYLGATPLASGGDSAAS